MSVKEKKNEGNDDGDDGYDENDDHGVEATTTETEQIERRDEVGEVRKMSSKDTNRLRWWRIVVTGVLLLSAFAVTFTTYTLLKQQEDENFQTAVCTVFGTCCVRFAVFYNRSPVFSLILPVCAICSHRRRCRC